jgi:preprotein translocase subunit SecD
MFQDLKSRAICLAIVILVSIVFLLPTFFKGSLPEKWLSKPISLGLDLKGGVHLVYEVQQAEAVSAKLASTLQGMRTELRTEKIAVTKARVAENSQLELQLLTPSLSDKAQDIIGKKFTGLRMVQATTTADGKGQLAYEMFPDAIKQIETDSITQAIEVLRNRVDQFGVSEPLIQRVGSNRILLQMPGETDIEKVKKVVGTIGRLEFKLVALRGGPGTVSLRQREGGEITVDEETLINGDSVESSSVEFDNGQVQVLLSFDSEGANIFRRVTTDNVGRQLAIILDNVVYSAPQIREPISGGTASISGRFTIDEGRQLKTVLRAALPAPLKVLEERTVGPSLGKESIQRGIWGILLGSAVIMLFMVLYYKKAGGVAVVTLALNLLFMLALLSAFGATLTLPGMAGLALTIGMAVDANVIIFERIKDELKVGAGRDASVSAGFDKAFSAIFDANITTLLSGFVLYYFGTGAIRGFAVTLCIGVLTTVFCATFVSRVLFDYFPMLGSKKPLSI